MFISKPQRIFSHLSLLAIIFCLVANPLTVFAQTKNKVKDTTTPYTTKEIVAEVNSARIEERIGSLTVNSALTLAAQTKANHMVANNYFSHWSPDGSTPWDFIENAGYDYQKAGENLAIRFVTTEKMVSSWLASPTHRANIMNANYKETGIGIAYGEINGKKGWVVVQMFGTK